MKYLKKFKIILAVSLIVVSSSLLAGGDLVGQTKSNIKAYANQKAVTETKNYLSKIFPTVELSLDLFNRSKPSGSILIVAPLTDPSNVKNTIFTQTSLYRKDDRTTVNIGLGYRNLSLNNTLMLGVNIFYDHEFPYDHQRLGLGVELKTSVGEINFNQYMKQSGWVSNGVVATTERALSGYDLEFGMPLPYMNWVTVFGKSFVWDAVDGIYDIKGNDISLRAKLPSLPGLTIEIGHRKFNGTMKKDQNFLKVEYNIMNTELPSQNVSWFSDQAYYLKDISDRRYQKVRRENLIYKQKKNNGVTTTGF
jgi:adhesin/invasin